MNEQPVPGHEDEFIYKKVVRDTWTGWQQGCFLDEKRYSHMTDWQKAEWDKDEKRTVRPSPKGNKLCICYNEDEAQWIAERLNFAASVQTKMSKLLPEGYFHDVFHDIVKTARERDSIYLAIIAHRLLEKLASFMNFDLKPFFDKDYE